MGRPSPRGRCTPPAAGGSASGSGRGPPRSPGAPRRSSGRSSAEASLARPARPRAASRPLLGQNRMFKSNHGEARVMAAGITSWGVYLPYWRLDRKAIALSLGGAPGKGSRAVASYDEDTTTLGVEAARRGPALPGPSCPDELLFSTPAPAYLDKTNATTVHAALGLPQRTGAYDLCGSVRSAFATTMTASAIGRGRNTLAVAADLRTGLAGGGAARERGDA